MIPELREYKVRYDKKDNWVCSFKELEGEELYGIDKIKHYGRGLAAYLIRENVEADVDSYDEDNWIVCAPGLFSSIPIPSTGRLVVASKKSRDCGMQFLNPAGPFSQKPTYLWRIGHQYF